jgi:hypothetical protein
VHEGDWSARTVAVGHSAPWPLNLGRELLLVLVDAPELLQGVLDAPAKLVDLRPDLGEFVLVACTENHRLPRTPKRERPGPRNDQSIDEVADTRAERFFGLI